MHFVFIAMLQESDGTQVLSHLRKTHSTLAWHIDKGSKCHILHCTAIHLLRLSNGDWLGCCSSYRQNDQLDRGQA